MESFYLDRVLLLLLIHHHFLRPSISYGYGGRNEMNPSEKKSSNIFDPDCFLISILNLTAPMPARNLLESMANISNTPLQTADGRNTLSSFPKDEPKSRDKVLLGKNKMLVKVSKSKKGIPDSLSVQILEDNSNTTKISPTILKDRELIKNPNFEHGLKGWTCYYCWASRVTGGYRSKYAAKIVNKGRRLGNLRTFLNAKQGFYYFTAYVKILNPTRWNIPYCPVTAYVKIVRSKGPIYLKLGETLRVQPHIRWYKVGGDFYVPANSNYMEVYVTVRMRKLHYLFDHASCSKIDYLPNWKEESNRRIKKIRKANIEVRLNVTSIPKGYKLSITQTKEKFKWGGCVKTWLINNSRYSKFSNFIYKNFNWAVIENGLKWANGEPHQGQIRLSGVKKTVDLLRRHQLHVRGHTLFYGISDPPWVKNLKGKKLLMALKNRIKDFMAPFKNKITNWDVSNENLRSSTYEILTHDPNITQKMFMMAHNEDPNAHLYFNENMIVNYGFSTVALEDRAVMYQEARIPLHGIGIQSHMTGNVNVFVLMRRLDEVAKAGLPLFISELTYENKDVRKRVLSYDNLLRIYFSHPAVEGIMFWSVWANHWRPTAALLDQHFNVNEVGRLFLSLKSEWSTSPIDYDLSRPVKKFSVFLGEYCAELTKSGQTIWKKCFALERPTSTAVLVISDSQEGSRQK